MTELMKSKQRKTHVMFASPIHNYRPKHTTRFERAASPFLSYLNTCTLAFALVIALALLTSIRGKDAETQGSALPKNTKTEVVIDNFSFSPRTFAVPLGATVTWTNHDNAAHTVTSTDNQFKKSPILQTGQRFSKTFATEGTYSYFCSIHPRMTGKIIVN
jgi:plastocyanin